MVNFDPWILIFDRCSLSLLPILLMLPLASIMRILIIGPRMILIFDPCMFDLYILDPLSLFLRSPYDSDTMTFDPR